MLGESNITSASISTDGTLLVVATSTELKAFQLDLRSELKQEKKVTTIGNLPRNHGATRIQISPDKRWVSWVEDGGKVRVAEITTDDASYAISASSKLNRVRRNIPKHILLGGLGTYDRNITHLTFSSDSKMLAAADLAGYIDTWILRGSDELGNGTTSHDDDARSVSSDDSSDEEGPDGTALGWIRNPRASLIPKLSSVPAALSFSDEIPGPAALVNGEGSTAGYTLLAVMASMQILVFNPLQGGLSDWSRRNHYAKLPEQFKNTRDIVKGVVWQGPVAWIYGPTFLFMLDLSQDLVPEDEAKDEAKDDLKPGTKRKRSQQGGGAGGKMHKHSLAPQTLKTTAEAGDLMEIEIEDADLNDSNSVATSSAFGDDDEDDEEINGGELQLKRATETSANGHERTRANWWHTYQYRSILGLVPLESTQQDEGVPSTEVPALEVAVIERAS